MVKKLFNVFIVVVLLIIIHLITNHYLYAGNWEQLKVKKALLDPDLIAVAPDDGNVIYVSLKGKKAEFCGIQKSIDAGKNWQKKYFHKREENLNTYYTFEDKFPHLQYSGAANYYNEEWYRTLMPLGQIIIDSKDSKLVYANVRRAGVFISKDSGETWAYYIDAFNRNNEKGLVFANLVIDPTQPDTLWANEGTYLYRLRGGKAAPGEPIVIGVPCDEKGIEIPQPAGKISFKGNYVKPEPGKNYVLLGPPAEKKGERDTASFFVRALCCDPAQPDTLYISVRLWIDCRGANTEQIAKCMEALERPVSQEASFMGSFMGLGTGEEKGGLYRSTDGGKSWSRLPFKGVPAVIKTFPTQPGKIFVNYKGKWSVSSDQGNTWSTLKLGGVTGIAPFLAF
ncbi:MAG: hypothetical protein AB1633_05325, partial [Elusimicrobiota bacterium]